jgi:hypothetical protein
MKRLSTARWGKVRASITQSRTRQGRQGNKPTADITGDSFPELENPMYTGSGEELVPAMTILRLMFKHFSQQSASKGGLDARSFMRFAESCPQLLSGYVTLYCFRMIVLNWSRLRVCRGIAARQEAELSFRLAARTNGSYLATVDEFVDAIMRIAVQKYPGFDSLVRIKLHFTTRYNATNVAHRPLSLVLWRITYLRATRTCLEAPAPSRITTLHSQLQLGQVPCAAPGS